MILKFKKQVYQEKAVASVIDCLKFKKLKTHLNYYEVIKYIKILNPKKTILTNLHSDIDYIKLKNKLSKLENNIVPAYDGMNIKI